jgi:hypothetical protein
MASTIVILKTGEQIICDLKEVYEGDGENKKGICLLMRHPYILSLVEVKNSDNPQQDLQVKFAKWCPYSSEYEFKIPYDVVVSYGISDAGLDQAYQSKVEVVEQVMNSRNAQLQQEEIEKVLASGGVDDQTDQT